MKLTVRFGLGLSAATGAVLAFGAVYVQSPSGTDELTRYLADDEVRQARELDNRQRLVLQRVMEKEAVVHALVRGEITLDQAAERFRQLTADDAAALAYLRSFHPAASDEELHYRNVLGFVRGMVWTHPARFAEVFARLEDEVRRRFPAPADGTAGRPPRLSDRVGPQPSPGRAQSSRPGSTKYLPPAPGPFTQPSRPAIRKR
jgi:hypothetical protein